MEGVVGYNGEVVGDADVFAGEDGVAVDVWVDVCVAEAEVVKGEGAVDGGGFVGIETPGVGFTAGDAMGGLFFR